MKGHVRRRGRSWVIVYDEGRDEHGKRRQRWVSGFRTRKDAEAELTRLKQSMADQAYVSPANLTFAAFVLDHFLPHVDATRRPATCELYRRVFTKRVLPLIGSVPLQKVDAGTLDVLYRKLGDPERKPRPLSPNTIRMTATVVSASLRYAKKKRMVVRNVAEDADVPSATRRKGSHWSAREVSTFLDSVADDRLYAFWRVMAVTGCRRGEGCGLAWRSVDLDGGSIRIEQQLTVVGKELLFGPPKTDSAEREISIDPVTVEVLREHKGRQELERVLHGVDYHDLDLCFCQPNGQPLNPGAMSIRFKKLARAAAMAEIRMHDLRHSSATLGLAQGMDVELVRRRLGHSRISTTIDIYQRHSVPDVEREAGNTLAAAIDDPRFADR